MKHFVTALIAVTFLAAGAAQAQNVNVRGTVTAFDGNVISVKARDGRDLQVELPEKVAVATTLPLKLADIKPGTPVGVTTIKRPDGQLVAIDVRPIPPTAGLGLSPHDLQPGSTMTNAILEGTMAGSGGNELTLNYKTGSVKVIVPPDTPMSRAAPGTRADIKPGETIFVAGKPSGEGRIVAARVQVSKDGVKPTQ